MAIDFPSSPIVGQTYLFAGVTYTYTASGVWAGGNTATGIVYTGSAAMPTSANPGDFWYDLSTGLLSVYVNDGNTSQWVQVSPVPAQPLATVITTDALANNGLQVNGGMEISQELGATALATGGGWLVDQWSGSLTASGAVASWQQVTDAPPGYNNSVKLTITTGKASLAAGDYCVFYQNIEGYRTSRLQWGKVTAQPVSIGFWTKIHRPGMYSGAVRNEATNRSYPFTFTQNVADTWEYKTVTIPGDTTGTWTGNTNTAGLTLLFATAMGTTFSAPAGAWAASNFMGATGTTNGIAAATDTFQLTGVVVLPGIELPSAAKAPFIMRSLDREISLCQRYFYNGVPSLQGVNGAGGTLMSRASCIHPVKMRMAPGLVLTAPLPVYDGTNVSTVTSLGANFSTADVLETECTLSAAVGAGRAPKVYQGSGGNLNVSARL
jgi:hypothetical protein